MRMGEGERASQVNTIARVIRSLPLTLFHIEFGVRVDTKLILVCDSRYENINSLSIFRELNGKCGQQPPPHETHSNLLRIFNSITMKKKKCNENHLYTRENQRHTECGQSRRDSDSGCNKLTGRALLSQRRLIIASIFNNLQPVCVSVTV